MASAPPPPAPPPLSRLEQLVLASDYDVMLGLDRATENVRTWLRAEIAKRLAEQARTEPVELTYEQCRAVFLLSAGRAQVVRRERVLCRDCRNPTPPTSDVRQWIGTLEPETRESAVPRSPPCAIAGAGWLPERRAAIAAMLGPGNDWDSMFGPSGRIREMRAHGQEPEKPDHDVDDPPPPVSLREVTLVCSFEDIRRVARFMEDIVALIDSGAITGELQGSRAS